MHLEKTALRQRMRERLVAMEPDWRHGAAQAVVEEITALKMWAEARVVGLFASRWDEVETSQFWGMGKRLAFPRVAGGELEFVEVMSVAELQVGALGVLEPTGTPVVEPDLVLVPGQAFDAQGGRLGRGKGFYDRWLAAHSGVKTVGVCFEFQIVEEVPMEAHDRRVDRVVAANLKSEGRR